ncbi:MAG: metallophosphoesterase [Clostridia bacterium]|nr:metallophosphoesterase [Clostridia bacterium]
MKIVETELKIGIEKPFDILHAADTHITLACEADGERKMKLAKRRAEVFPTAMQDLRDIERLCAETGLPLIHSGDLIDFTSVPNYEAGAEFIRKTDCFISVGNHEFSQYVGEAWEDDAYRAQTADKAAAMCGNDITFDSRVIGGVNFVAIDNGYYLFKRSQLEMLKKEVAKGMPVVLTFHDPLYERRLYDTMLGRGSECAYLVAVPEELMSSYSEHRFRQQKADEPTLEAVDYMAHEPSIKAILTGHIHFDYEGVFAGRIPQIVTGCGSVRRIHIS